MQTTHKIAGDDAEGFADYLTRTSARGDYYVEGEGQGRWHGAPDALVQLGIDREQPVQREELLALMRGVSPETGEAIRKAGGNGTRVAGVDMTFSAPKSVSALWALSGEYRRAQIEQAHHRAVASALERVEREVALVRSRREGALEWDLSRSIIAAEFLHTSSRLTRGQEADGVPDPQLHSHLVVLTAQRIDGRFAAVDSRELFRSARVNGAWYRAELAANLQELGVEIRGGTGRDARYFEVVGVPQALAEQWSARGAEVERAFREFRTRYGRDPRAGELSSITIATRGTKTASAPVDLDAAWRAVGEEHGLGQDRARELFDARDAQAPEVGARSLARQLPQDLTGNVSMFSERDLQARAYELAAGRCRPQDAQAVVQELERDGELLRLEDGMWTTRQLRELEQQTIERAQALREKDLAPVSEWALGAGVRRAECAIDGQLSDEQRDALQQITGTGGLSVLVGQAGTGKGVVIHAAAEAWREDGYTVLGTAVAGATAERLAAEGKLDRANTTDSLLRAAENDRLQLDRKTVIVMDEAGMADTKRLSRLVDLAERSGNKLLLVGDHAQLLPIGARGLFAELQKHAPTAELTEVRRARHEWERDAWQQIRAGEPEPALAAYQQRERLHIAEDRYHAAREMVDAWDQARREVGEEQAVMLTDASNAELDRINHLAQQARERGGELGQQRAALRGRPYELAPGDRIIFTAPLAQPGAQRVENGTTGTVEAVDKHGRLAIITSGPNSRQVHADTRQFQGLKLAYAQHVYKAQGLTCERAFVLAGGWQTDRERAYVALSRARERTDIYLARTDLGEDELDRTAVDRLAGSISQSGAHEASISREEQARQLVDAARERVALTRRRPRGSGGRPREPSRPEPRPLSEIGHIQREQQARERAARRDVGSDLGL